MYNIFAGDQPDTVVNLKLIHHDNNIEGSTPRNAI